MSENEDQNPSQSGEQMLSDAGKKTGRTAGKLAGKVAKKAGKAAAKLAKKAAMQVGKLILKALVQALIALLPYLLPILVIIGIAVIGYYILFDSRGNLQEYSYNNKAQNQTQMTYTANSGYQVATTLSTQNEEIKNFYAYYSAESYYQLVKGKLQKPNPKLYDYYHKENEFDLSPYLLFSLDQFLNKGDFFYPNQFDKVINYDPTTLKVVPLVNKWGRVLVQSNDYGSNGLPNGKKINSIADYGLAPIFKYQKAQDIHRAIGYYYKEDVVQGNHVTQKNIHQPYNDVLSGYPQPIHIMTYAVTYSGEHSFQYKVETNYLSPLQYGEGQADTPMIKVPYATATIGKGKNAHTVTLYLYRKGAVYKEIPVQIKDNFTSGGNNYLESYITHFEEFVPKNVLNNFNLNQTLVNLVNTKINVGEGTSTNKYASALQYLPIVQKWATRMGFPDPYLLVAQIAQESGGDPTAVSSSGGYGLAQITGSHGGEISGRGANGTWYSVPVTQANEFDPNKAIEMMAIIDESNFQNYLKQDTTDPLNAELKTISAYNMGDGTMQWIQDNYPQYWSSFLWINPAITTAASQAELNGGGDPLYVEHVLSYYGGQTKWSTLLKMGSSGSSTGSQSGGSSILGNIGNIIKQIGSAVTNAVTSIFVRHYGTNTKYVFFKNWQTAFVYDWILRMADAMNMKIPFSDTNPSAMGIYSQNFAGSSANQNLTLGDLKGIISDVGQYQSPIGSASGTMVAPYGNIVTPTGSTIFNDGVDVSVVPGTRINSVTSGMVQIVVNNQSHAITGLGNYVTILNDDGTTATYAHLDEVTVQKNQRVIAGQEIGLSGATGDALAPYLGFTLATQNGNYVDPSSIFHFA